jgi:hypothetical protein
VLTPTQYYRVTTQAEYSTDLVFKPRQQLADFVLRLLEHSTLCSARDVLSFHVYGLIAKIPRSRRWRVTGFGHRVMGASVRLRHQFGLQQ